MSGCSTPIYDFVSRYAASGTSRLHMPGHKGAAYLGCEGRDITEIKGADELYEAEGIIAESEASAAALFGSARTFYGTEGSSQCIRAMVFLALQAAPPCEGKPVLLAARNAHKALIYTAALLDIEVCWLWPEESAPDSLCSCPVSAPALQAALARLAEEGKRPFGVYLTSPDYLGGMQDVAALSEVCHRQGLPLLVDNAHGAYLHFLPGGSRHPIALGADACCDSGHKTLPVLTGGAYLHIGRGLLAPSEEAVQGAMCLFGSTSPSYLILQSLDLCNRALSEDYPARLAGCVQRLETLRRSIAGLACGLVWPSAEPLKLVLDASALGLTGKALAEGLRAGKVECEYADDRAVVLMFTPDNPPRDDERVYAALKAAVQDGAGCAGQTAAPAACLAQLAAQAVQRCSIRQAMFGAQERIPARQALGRVCALPTVGCPPAIPIAVSGEELGEAALALFARYGVQEVAVLR